MANPQLRILSDKNGFVPQTTGQVVAYIRTEGMFPLHRYVQYMPAPSPIGLYAMLGRDEPVRAVSDDEDAFADGDEAPRGIYNQIPFTWQSFVCDRRATAWQLGYIAIETANSGGAFKPKIAHMAMAISKRMTKRTNRVVSVLTTTGNWGTHVGSANSLNNGAGLWTTGTTDDSSGRYLAIFKTLTAAALQINLDTNGIVDPTMLRVILNPYDAVKMAQSPELVGYVRETPDALRLLEGGFDPFYSLWGIPRRYKGFEFVVENTPYVSKRPTESTQTAASPLHPPEEPTTGVSPGRLYAWPSGTAVIVARPGALEGVFGSPSFSTMQLYHYGPLLDVRVFDEPRNERVSGRVQENVAYQMASNISGYLITGIT